MPISLSIDFDVATASISSVACRAFFICAYIVVRGRTGLPVGLFHFIDEHICCVDPLLCGWGVVSMCSPFCSLFRLIFDKM